jgi:predicted DsbA family dithiol-disulfide isomerase
MTETTSEPALELVQFTDPYCTWCWGAEPILRRIHEIYGNQVRQRFVVGGLVRDIREFLDPTNNIGGAQWYVNVAQHWNDASTQHGMPVEGRVFYDQKDEIFSTYPACIAFKAAQFQDDGLSQRYLRRLREGAAAERLIIQRINVQTQLAEEVGLNPAKLRDDIRTGRAEEAFRADLRECKVAGVRSFPTFLIRNVATSASITLVGYCQFEKFAGAFRQLTESPLQEAVIQINDDKLLDFVRRYRKVAGREVAEVFGLTDETVRHRLAQLACEQFIKQQKAGNGVFYLSAH